MSGVTGSTLVSLREDYHFRTVYTTMISALITFGFTVFNGVIGVLYRSVWNISICIYYVLLAVVRRIIVRSQRKTVDKNQDKEIIKKTYVVTHIILILIDVALVVPIALTRYVYVWYRLSDIKMVSDQLRSNKYNVCINTITSGNNIQLYYNFTLIFSSCQIG